MDLVYEISEMGAVEIFPSKEGGSKEWGDEYRLGAIRAWLGMIYVQSEREIKRECNASTYTDR